VSLKNDTSEDDDITVHETLVGDPISAGVRARLRLEHASAAASDQWEHYPPSPKRSLTITVGIVAWAVSFGIWLGLNGLLAFNPVSGDVTADPGIILGLIIGVCLIITNLPDFDRVTPESPIKLE